MNLRKSSLCGVRYIVGDEWKSKEKFGIGIKGKVG